MQTFNPSTVSPVSSSLNELVLAKTAFEIKDSLYSLKDAAFGLNLFLGTAINKNYLDDKQYTSLAKKNYDIITAENACKMHTINYAEGKTSYDGCLNIKKFSEENGMEMRAHNLVWPGTVKNNPWVNNMTNASDLKKFMNDYITETVHTVGDVYSWDVVNELFGWSNVASKYKNFPYEDSIFYEIGPPEDTKSSWVCEAFKTAKAANPKIKMFYNDDKISSSAGKYEKRSDETYKIMKFLVDNECGIDGVGFESHVGLDFADKNYDSIKADIQRYAALGLEVMFTEVDVRCNRSLGPCAWGDAAWP